MTNEATINKLLEMRLTTMADAYRPPCVYRNIRTAIPETSGHETGGIRTLCRLI